MIKIEQWKQLEVKIDLINCILPKGKWFRIFHEEDNTPVLFLITRQRNVELARGIDQIDDEIAGWFIRHLSDTCQIENFLKGRIFQ